MDDDLLMGRLCRGEVSALEQLYRRHADRVFRLALRLTGRREEADDITQDVFVRIWEYRAAYSPERRFRAWALRICLNQCRDRARRCRERAFLDPSSAEAMPDRQPLPEETAVDRLMTSQFAGAFLRLTEPDQQLLALRLDGEIGVEEIAEVLGCSVRTVHYKTREVIQRVRRMLGEDE
ncbi:MAG TPA: sigma-70 family RNA polymerase sigma factor [Candidatus Ozemobacteraceae bacterium]